MTKKEIIRALIVVICVVVVVLIIKLIQGIDTTKKDLKKLGYSKEDINIIVEKLNEDEINEILSLEYSPKLTSILNNKYYISYNLKEYLSYSKNKDNIDEVISLVNVGADNDWYTNTKQTNIELGNKMLVNKYNYLPDDYAPNDIVNIKNWYAYDGHRTKQEVYNQYVKMWNKANENGLVLIVNSSYRTLAEQEEQYNMSSDDYASRPGFSEHQTGLALDIVTYDIIGNEFENTEEFEWLQTNAHKYGFILRYPKNKEKITGYSYESWHYRYLGVDLATKVYESGLTYDEYYAYYCEYKNEC